MPATGATVAEDREQMERLAAEVIPRLSRVGLNVVSVSNHSRADAKAPQIR
ncbi:hypothetical protein [Mycolicibacterium wolinskyi]|uniref:hypothetical protein n=1 Tax=Mycolicibacterium wolinskyi TaxID=59750 RepID=UPI00391772EE